MSWYVLKNRRHVGPYQDHELVVMYRQRTLGDQDFVIAQGDAEAGELKYRRLKDVMNLENSPEDPREGPKFEDFHEGREAPLGTFTEEDLEKSVVSRVFSEAFDSVDFVKNPPQERRAPRGQLAPGASDNPAGADGVAQARRSGFFSTHASKGFPRFVLRLFLFLVLGGGSYLAYQYQVPLKEKFLSLGASPTVKNNRPLGGNPDANRPSRKSPPTQANVPVRPTLRVPKVVERELDPRDSRDSVENNRRAPARRRVRETLPPPSDADTRESVAAEEIGSQNEENEEVLNSSLDSQDSPEELLIHPGESRRRSRQTGQTRSAPNRRRAGRNVPASASVSTPRKREFEDEYEREYQEPVSDYDSEEMDDNDLYDDYEE